MIFFALGLLLGISVGFFVAAFLVRREARSLGTLSNQMAILTRRLGSWVQRQPTEKAPADATFRETEIPTKPDGQQPPK